MLKKNDLARIIKEGSHKYSLDDIVRINEVRVGLEQCYQTFDNTGCFLKEDEVVSYSVKEGDKMIVLTDIDSRFETGTECIVKEVDRSFITCDIGVFCDYELYPLVISDFTLTTINTKERDVKIIKELLDKYPLRNKLYYEGMELIKRITN